ncbi:MAG: hypothetical protein O2820_24545 [Planctomycetota bacterium]|nr:hypothetical protein [Planctomycetota bacterium]MDA1252384.1 hypothetical protein [Planctomycetota bacterium]
MRHCSLVFLCALTFFLTSSTEADAARIDATKGRQYKLTRQHGPWMIMVASLAQPHSARKVEGMGPQEAADLLVYELRKKGIPAYTFKMDQVWESLQSQDRLGRDSIRQIRSQKGAICVIAGNYKSQKDRVAQRTLEYIKKIKPSFWKDQEAFRPTPGQPSPLSGAFLSVNPLLSSEELAERKHDPLLLRLNSGEYTIAENTGKYTLTIATFTGRSKTGVGESRMREIAETFTVSEALDSAAERAWKVAKMLREGHFEGQQSGRTFEAYVFHDRYKSVVTVGSFETPNDPRIAQLANLFRAKTQNAANGRRFTIGESILIPGAVPEPIIFDPVPKLMAVPIIR